MSEDPIAFEGGDTNLYAYVLNRPTVTTDPTGEIAPIIAAAVACGAGAVGGTAVVLSGRKPSWKEIGAGAAIGCGGGLAVLGGVALAAAAAVPAAGGALAGDVAALAAAGGAASTAIGRASESLRYQLATGTGPWTKLATHIEQATSKVKHLRGGISREEAFIHSATGEKLFRHTIVKDGAQVYEQIRDFSKVFR